MFEFEKSPSHCCCYVASCTIAHSITRWLYLVIVGIIKVLYTCYYIVVYFMEIFLFFINSRDYHTWCYLVPYIITLIFTLTSWLHIATTIISLLSWHPCPWYLSLIHDVCLLLLQSLHFLYRHLVIKQLHSSFMMAIDNFCGY